MGEVPSRRSPVAGQIRSRRDRGVSPVCSFQAAGLYSGTAAVGQGPHVAEEADQRLFAAFGGEVGRTMNQS